MGTIYSNEYKGIKFNVCIKSHTTNSNGQKLYEIDVEDFGVYYKYCSSMDFAIREAKDSIDSEID